MESSSTASGVKSIYSRLAGWQKILVWVVGALVLLNVVPILLNMPAQSRGSPANGLILLVVIALALSIPFGGLNLVRTAFNRARADFKRTEDAARSAYVWDVRPARASWLAVLVPLPLCLLVAFWGVMAAWMAYVGLGIYLLVVGIFVMPGAKHRKPARIVLSPEGLEAGSLRIPLDQIADIEVANKGVKVSDDALVAGPGGIPTSTLVGRGLGRRQAARSYTLAVRAEGQSRSTVIAGGLTEECAFNLGSDIDRVLTRLSG